MQDQPHAPQVRDDIEVLEGPEGAAGPRQGVSVMVRDPRSGEVFRIGAEEHFLMRRLDGRHGYPELAEAFAAHFDCELSPEAYEGVVGMLRDWALLADRTHREAREGEPSDAAAEGPEAPARQGPGAPEDAPEDAPGDAHEVPRPPAGKRRRARLAKGEAPAGAGAARRRTTRRRLSGLEAAFGPAPGGDDEPVGEGAGATRSPPSTVAARRAIGLGHRGTRRRVRGTSSHANHAPADETFDSSSGPRGGSASDDIVTARHAPPAPGGLTGMRRARWFRPRSGSDAGPDGAARLVDVGAPTESSGATGVGPGAPTRPSAPRPGGRAGRRSTVARRLRDARGRRHAEADIDTPTDPPDQALAGAQGAAEAAAPEQPAVHSEPRAESRPASPETARPNAPQEEVETQADVATAGERGPAGVDPSQVSAPGGRAPGPNAELPAGPSDGAAAPSSPAHAGRSLQRNARTRRGPRGAPGGRAARGYAEGRASAAGRRRLRSAGTPGRNETQATALPPNHWSLCQCAPLFSALAERLRPLRHAVLVLPLGLVLSVFTIGNMFLPFIADFQLNEPRSLVIRLLFSMFTVNLAAVTAYGLVAAAYGVSVRSFGLKLVLGLVPRFDAALEPFDHLPKRQRLWLHAAPLLGRLGVFCVGIVAWASLRETATQLPELAQIMAIVALFATLLVGNPLLRSSGYEALATWLDRPFLRREANQAFMQLISRGRRGSPGDYGAMEGAVLQIYAAASLLFIVTIALFILLALGYWLELRFEGFGVFTTLVFAGYVFWFYRSVQKARRRRAPSLGRRAAGV